MPQTFPPSARLRRRSEFTGVFDRGVKRHGQLMSVCVQAMGERPARLGIAASKKVGGAVERNLAKRRLREVFRRLDLPAGLEIVVMPRQSLLKAPWAAVRQEFEQLVQSAVRHGRRPSSSNPRRAGPALGL